jgi:CheY-like chemotaxis protein
VNNAVAEPAKRILIVDDSVEDILLLTQTFAKARVINPVQTVDSVAEAIKYIEGTHPYADRKLCPLPAIVFVDLHLPGIDGFEFLGWLQAREDTKEMLIVTFTGVDDYTTVRRAYKMGASSFITKPCRKSELLSLMRSFPKHWVRSTSRTDEDARIIIQRVTDSHYLCGGKKWGPSRHKAMDFEVTARAAQ